MASEAYERVTAHVERHGDKIQAAFSILGMKSLLAEIDRLKEGAPKSTTKPTAYLLNGPDDILGVEPSRELEFANGTKLTPADVEAGWTETPLYAYHVTQHPTNGLWQTFDQVHGERDLLLMSVRALQYKIERLNRLSKSRLTKLRKARERIARGEAAMDRAT